jgi:hypothetical protein
MLPEAAARLDRELPADALVLDVGGWGCPYLRADWVVDQMPYETRGLYGFDGAGPDRSSSDRWVIRDLCDKEPLPFADDHFDFVICSQTLEDLRDPIWVSRELSRVGRAGYIELPSRLEEQTYGVHGPWVGWSHHHWLADIGDDHIDFVFKHHVLHGNIEAQFPQGFADRLTPLERVQQLWWTGGFTVAERTLSTAEETDDYFTSYVATEMRNRGVSRPKPPSLSRRAVNRLRRAL